MDMQLAMLNLSYLLIAVGLMVTDVLRLRAIILASEGMIFYYGFAVGNTPIMLWNVLFMGINAVRIGLLIRERRPVKIPEKLSDIYTDIFAGLNSREFLYFWNTGKTITVHDEVLCRENENQDELLLILDGKVSIQKDSQEVAQLTRGSFVAEMSFLTGSPASADAVGIGDVRCIVWSQEKVAQLQDLNRDLLMKLQLVLGRDISAKLKEETEDDLRAGSGSGPHE
jgi:hypothetical protein